MMLLLVFLLATVLSAEAKLFLERNQARIVNGQNVADGDFPYTVSIQNSGVHFCGGVLIDASWVLTAAHCISSPTGSHSVLVNAVSQSNPGPGAAQYSITEVRWNPAYNDPAEPGHYPNDIALVKLSVPAAAAGLANLPSDDTSDYSDSQGTILGWGVGDNLQKFTGQLLSQSQCQAAWAGFNVTIPSTNICISGNGGACNGDSGGPMLVGDTVVGVASFGNAGCQTIYPSVFTRVSKYLDWISSQIAG